MRTTPLLAALLMLGGVSGAYAQDGPSEGTPSMSERGSATTQERASGRDAGVSKGSENGNQGRGASKSDDNDTGRAAEKSQQPNEKSTSGRAANDERTGEKSKSSAKSEDSGSQRMGREGPDTTDKAAQSKEGSPTGQTDRSATDTRKGSTATDRSAEGKASGDKAKHVDLTGDKRTKVQTALRDAGTNVKHHTGVNIDISVGRRLPRDWGYVPVPQAVLEIVPEYRGYYFAYVEDEYVIVDPDTYEVVAVLPAEGRQAGASSGRGNGQCSAQLSLSRKEQELILDNVKGGREADVGDVRVGRDVPPGVELQRFPQSVIAEARELEGCQYFDAGDQIAIVNPDENKIVGVIEKS